MTFGLTVEAISSLPLLFSRQAAFSFILIISLVVGFVTKYFQDLVHLAFRGEINKHWDVVREGPVGSAGSVVSLFDELRDT